jgi:hypothetical protein
MSRILTRIGLIGTTSLSVSGLPKRRKIRIGPYERDRQGKGTHDRTTPSVPPGIFHLRPRRRVRRINTEVADCARDPGH